MHSLKRRANSCTISQTINRAVALIVLAALIVLFPLSRGVNTVSADGRGECVMELSTGTVVHSRNAFEKMPMASTTKIMTALLIIEDCDLSEVITVPDEAVGVEGSSIYLKKDEIISVKDLVYGLMMRSGNDSAAVLAIHHSGSVQKFAECMNARAAEMGARDTNFTNPSGLPDENHYTTASDLCLIACNAMKNEQFKKIVSARNYTGEYRSFVNKNKFLGLVEGANGVKTGYTISAGRCLVSSAEREGMDIVCAVLNCPDMYERSQKLIEQAFSQYELKKIECNRVFMCDIVPCKIANDEILLIRKGEELKTEIARTYFYDEINVGDEVGQLEIYCQNDLIFKGILYSIVNRRNIF